MTGAFRRSRWADWTLRSVLFQTALLIAVGVIAYQAFSNVAENLARQSITSGFGFLGNTAGFSIIQTLIPYSEQSTYGRVFLVGLLNTGLVAVLGIVLATGLGITIGCAGVSRNWVVRALANAYVEIMRNIPLLLHLFFWYFAILRPLPRPKQSLVLWDAIYLNNRGLYLPQVTLETGQTIAWLACVFSVTTVIAIKFYAGNTPAGTVRRLRAWPAGFAIGGIIVLTAYLMGEMSFAVEFPRFKTFNVSGGISVIPEFVALLLALSLYTAAFIGEIVRAGINAVPGGQMEAARVVGLSHLSALRLVVIPQALRLIVPPLTSQYLNITKNSSLAVAIAYPDLVSVFAGTALNQTGQAVEILMITMAVYLCFSLITSAIMNWYNARNVPEASPHG